MKECPRATRRHRQQGCPEYPLKEWHRTHQQATPKQECRKPWIQSMGHGLVRERMRARKKPRSSAKAKTPQSSAHRTRSKSRYAVEQDVHGALHAMMYEELSGLGGFTDIEFVALTQFSLKKGLERFGKPAAEAVYKETKQLHDRKTIRPRHLADLTINEKRKALSYLMFIKEKRCGTIKGRGCADGRKQWIYKTKEETSSPTVRTESLFVSCTIDAKERRLVMTCDVVPGTFMKVDIDEIVHVRLTGPLLLSSLSRWMRNCIQSTCVPKGEIRVVRAAT